MHFLVNLWSNYKDESSNETYTCDEGHRDGINQRWKKVKFFIFFVLVDCKNEDDSKTLTCDITEVPTLNDPPHNGIILI